MMRFGFTFLTGLLLISSRMSAQDAQLWLKDAKNGEAVPFAHVMMQERGKSESKTFVSDLDGKVRVVSREPLVFTVSALGYRLFSDTLKPGSKKIIQLEPLVYNMDEVVVTGQFTPEAVDKSIFKVKVIGLKQVEQKASTNLGELMAGELNIRSSMDGALGSKITMQGLGGEHIKFLIDGVPLIGRMNGNIDLGQLNLQNIKQIEVIEGPMSVIYGSNALAGVINIITGDNPYSTISVQTNAYTESVGVYNFSMDGSFKKNRWTSGIAAARNFFDGFDQIEDQRSMRWKPKRQYTSDAHLGYTSTKLKAKTAVSYFNEMLQDKGNLLRPYYETAFDNYFQTNRFSAKFDAQAPVAKDRFINVLASYSYYNRIKNTYFVDLTTLEKNLTMNGSDQDTSVFGQYLLRAEFSKSTTQSRFNYQFGIDLNQETGAGKRMLDERQQIGDYAAFLSLKLQPTPLLMLQPGLRYGFNTKYNAPLVYSLNLKWDLREELSLRASFAKGFRAPSLKELYLEFVDVNHNIRGNENLKAENSKNINLALSYHHEKKTYDYGADLSFFYNKINNSITLATLSYDSALYTYVNLNRMITQGYQLSFHNRLYPWFELKAGVGHIGRRQITDGAAAVKMIYSTDIMANLSLLWRKIDLRFDVNYKYNGAYPEVFVNSDGAIFRSLMDAYHSLDANVSRSFLGQRLTVQFGAKNLFGNTNILIRGDSQGGIHSGAGDGSAPVAWGRTFFVRAAYRFQKFSRNHEN